VRRVGRRSALVAAAVLIQAAMVPAAVYPSLSARLTGAEYLLAVRPLDPIDPFRGAYVALGYPDLRASDPVPTDPSQQPRMEPTGTLYVPLVRNGELLRGGPAVRQRPETAPFLRCESDGWSRRCGIESLFLPQDKAATVEADLAAGGAVARIRVDRRGNAAVVAVEPRLPAKAEG
jgi:uncharacterized membrane-anchored protein